MRSNNVPPVGMRGAARSGACVTSTGAGDGAFAFSFASAGVFSSSASAPAQELEEKVLDPGDCSTQTHLVLRPARKWWFQIKPELAQGPKQLAPVPDG